MAAGGMKAEMGSIPIGGCSFVRAMTSWLSAGTTKELLLAASGAKIPARAGFVGEKYPMRVC